MPSLTLGELKKYLVKNEKLSLNRRIFNFFFFPLCKMFSIHQFKDKFEIPPSCLSSKCKQEIEKIVKNIKNRTVSMETGAILEVLEVEPDSKLRIVDSKIYTNVSYKCLSFMPVIDTVVYSGVITLIWSKAIMIEAEGLVKVVIQPLNMPSGFKFDAGSKTFSNSETGESYATGDTIFFKIKKYNIGETQNINCIGSIKDINETHVIEPPDDF